MALNSDSSQEKWRQMTESHLSDPVLYYAAAASLVGVSMIFATLSSVISGTTSIHCKKNMRNSAIKISK